jgi:molecular chaperone HscB
MAGDAFEVLGLVPRFEIDPGELQAAYLARARLVHPDHAGPGDGAGDRPADGAIAALNAARTQLADPERRANLLLARLGGPAPEADRSLPPGFLAGIMEAREELAAAQDRGDAEAVERWLHWAEARRSEHAARVGALLSSSAASHAVLRDARRELNAWRYIERMIEQLDGGGAWWT